MLKEKEFLPFGNFSAGKQSLASGGIFQRDDATRSMAFAPFT